MKRVSPLRITVCWIISFFRSILQPSSSCSVPLRVPFVDFINRLPFLPGWIGRWEAWGKVRSDYPSYWLAPGSISAVNNVPLSKTTASIYYQVALSYDFRFLGFPSNDSFLASRLEVTTVPHLPILGLFANSGLFPLWTLFNHLIWMWNLLQHSHSICSPS